MRGAAGDVGQDWVGGRTSKTNVTRISSVSAPAQTGPLHPGLVPRTRLSDMLCAALLFDWPRPRAGARPQLLPLVHKGHKMPGTIATPTGFDAPDPVADPGARLW
ncbi:hypothetical protein VTJ49DRAFT_6216 [Mycothermus thermophilus]|uniref:Uncharacterized protein n=1 Tax=Humicola insolens TaxID=85995 RepID=A0ABR3VJA4_HUMIN